MALQTEWMVLPFTEAEGTSSFSLSYLSFSPLCFEIVQLVFLCQAHPCLSRKQTWIKQTCMTRPSCFTFHFSLSSFYTKCIQQPGRSKWDVRSLLGNSLTHSWFSVSVLPLCFLFPSSELSGFRRSCPWPWLLNVYSLLGKFHLFSWFKCSVLHR